MPLHEESISIIEVHEISNHISEDITLTQRKHKCIHEWVETAIHREPCKRDAFDHLD